MNKSYQLLVQFQVPTNLVETYFKFPPGNLNSSFFSFVITNLRSGKGSWAFFPLESLNMWMIICLETPGEFDM